MVLKSYCKNLVIDRELIESAYKAWLSGQAGKKNEHRVIEEYGSSEALVEEILWEITFRTLSFRPIHRYERVEPTNGKHRIIGVESVKQQVCDYIAILAMQPFLDARTGFYQVASIPGKGQRLARGALRRWSRERRTYHVKADVRQCYPSIKSEMVMRILRKYVRSADVLYLSECLLTTYGNGLEIGSFFSLKMAVLVLSFAYHHIESLGKVRRGKWVPLVRHQVWHMDDLVLISTDKRDLKRAVRSLERFLASYGLALKPWKVARTGADEPLDMGGWVVRDGRVTLRAGIFLRASRAFRHFAKAPSLTLARRCCSYWGWFKNSDSDSYMHDNGIPATMRRARRKVAAHDRQEARNGAHEVGDAA